MIFTVVFFCQILSTVSKGQGRTREHDAESSLKTQPMTKKGVPRAKETSCIPLPHITLSLSLSQEARGRVKVEEEGAESNAKL
jgi:hypothetical protein